MSLSKRLFIGRRDTKEKDDESLSECSEVSTSNDSSWFARLRIGSSGDSALDDMLRNVYEDPDVLEEKCREQGFGISSSKSSSDNGTDITGGGTTFLDNTGASGDAVKKSCRRLSVTKMSKNPQNVVDSLEKEFFDPDFDPVLHQLKMLEKWDKSEMMEKFMATIEETDTDKDMILVKLAEMIETNYSELMDCMRDVHAIDVDLTRTGFQITNSRRKLESGNKLIVTGTMDIARLSLYRSNLDKVRELLSRIQCIKNLFTSLENHITTGDVGQAAECAYDLLITLQNDYLSESGGIRGRIHAVENYSESVQRLLPAIRQKTDKALYRLASRRFSTPEYENILKAYLILDDMQENMGVCVTGSRHNSSLPAEYAVDSNTLFDEDGCLEGFARRLQRYHMSDVTTCLHSALQEVIYSDYHSKDTSSGTSSELLDLDGMSLDELCDRVSPELFIPCIIRSCELLANVVHTNYLITQWHKKPFDKRNEDNAFLHRSATEDSISDNEDVDEEGGQRRASVTSLEDMHSGMTADDIEEKRVERLRSARLSDVHQGIIANRFYLWKEVELAIVGFLHNLLPHEVLNLDDFVCMLWTLETFSKLGSEFGGTSCSPLRSSIEEQSINYARNVHIESCQLLHQMLTAEPWKSVPIQLGEMGGILGILRMNLLKQDGGEGAAKTGKTRIYLKGMVDEAVARSKYRAHVTTTHRANLARKYSSSDMSNGELSATGLHPQNSLSPLTSDTSKSILTSFHYNGNPFSRAVDTPSANADAGGSSPKRRDRSSGDFQTSYLTDMLTLLLGDDNPSSPSKRSQERTAAMVVTQTSLYGLSKFSGQYLQIMQLMPPAAFDLYEGMCHLFDFYLFAVFVGFVSPDDRQMLFAKHSRNTAPPPQQAQEFEALKNRMKDMLSNSNGKGDGMTSHSNPFMSMQLLQDVDIPAAVRMSDGNNYFALNERIVAAESCWFAAKLLSELRPKIAGLLPEEHEDKVKRFVSDYQQVADQLRSLIYRSMCPLLIEQSNIMQQLVENSGWEQKKMREEPHEWVDMLVNLCTEVWEYMEEGEEFAEASAMVREQVWLELCQCAFDTVLEGLSRVKKCSTEGRASMTMDISALHTGLDSVHVCRPPRGKQYVDNYVKALYLSDEEIVHWSQQNWQSYAQRHLNGLLNQAMSSVMKKKRLKDSLAALDALYEQNDFDV